MGLYLADFVTGRTIGRDDGIVALVIVPAEGGYPDAVRSAASPPVYPHDRFEPISLPIHGTMNEHGYFQPSPQLALDLLLETAKVGTWQEFESQALNEKDQPFEFSHRNQKMADLLGMRRLVVPGLALMHRSTFETLLGLSGVLDTPADAVDRARAICLDAQHRWAQDGDASAMGPAELKAPPGRQYETVDGRVIEVPYLLHTLSSGSGTALNVFAMDTIIHRNKKAFLGDGAELTATLMALNDFQRVCQGLHALNRYWAPSAFTRFDNLKLVAELQSRDLVASLSGVTERLNLGPEYRDAEDQRLRRVADLLRGALDTLETELASQGVGGPTP